MLIDKKFFSFASHYSFHFFLKDTKRCTELKIYDYEKKNGKMEKLLKMLEGLLSLAMHDLCLSNNNSIV